MERIARACLVALALALPARAQSPAEAPPAEPAPEALAQAWFDQLFGGDAFEIWQTEWSGESLSYGVARRWQEGRPELFVHIVAPRAYDELNFLLRERDEQRFEILYYRTPKLFPGGSKTARVMPIAKPGPLERLPFAPGLPVIAELVPAHSGEYTWSRLPATRIKTADCRVIEGRPLAADRGFDRVVLALARETGVALDTKWFQGASLVRHVTTAPADVRDEDGRFLPIRRSVEQPGQEIQDFVSLRLMLDPVFPEQLFTTQNLKTGRFPTY
jgi:hypothetical protein